MPFIPKKQKCVARIRTSTKAIAERIEKPLASVLRVVRGALIRQRGLASVEVDRCSVVASNFEAESVVVANRHCSTKLLTVIAAVQCE